MKIQGEGFEILIVEDSPTQAEELKYTLERHGFVVMVAGNGGKALSMIRERKPTMVISDIVMPEMDGYQLCREIKNDDNLKDLHVILLTALSDPRDVVKGLECGADNFITKPYDEKYILSRIQYILANMHLKDMEKFQLGVEVVLAGERYFIKSDRLQILNLLLSSYEAAIQKNVELTRARDEMRALSGQLEQKVKERTAALSEEIKEHKRTEEALIEAKEEWERTFDAITDPVMVLGVDYRIVKLNRAMAAKMGRKPADAVGLRCFETVHGCKEPPLFCPHAMLLTDGFPHSADIHEERLGGDFLVDVSPLRSVSGELVGSVHYARDITAIKEAQRSLRDEQKRFRDALDRLPAYLVLLTPDYRVPFANRFFEERFGKSGGRRCYEYLFNRTEPCESCETYTVLKTNAPHHWEWRGPDGRDYDIHDFPFIDMDGSPLIMEVGFDITDLKQTERLLKESEEKFRSLSETATNAITMIDNEGDIAYWNPAAERIFGYPAHEVMGKSLHLLLAPERYHDLYRKGFARYRETGDGPAIGKTLEMEAVRKDGKEIPVEVSFSVTLLNNERYAIGMIRDITERKSAEEALRLANDYNRCLIEASIDPLVTIGRDGRITDVNSATEKVTGVHREGLIGRDFSDIFTDREMAKAGYQLVFNEGSVRDYELEIRHADGHVTPVLYNASVYRDEKDEVAGVFAAARDMSVRRNLEEQLRQLQKMEAIGQLAGGIAHDFNNILMTIVGFGTILKLKLGERDPIQTDIDQILAASDRAAHLTQSMLAYSRKQFMSPKPVDLNDIVRSREKFLRRVIGENSELILKYSDRPLKVFADSNQIQQVLTNLATNGRDAMPNGGTLAISTESVEIEDRFLNINEFAKKGPYAVLTFSDTGIGMDKSTVDRIFDPFFTTKEVGKGIGLGLSMVYGIVRQHDGFITCYSEPGKGTSFRIYLPIIHGEVGEGSPLQHIQMIRGRETILLADDDPTSRSVSRHYLENFGYKVIEASDGEEAVRKFIEQREKIDLALVDVIMPRLNGMEVYRRIKEMKPDVKVIFMSGYAADIIHKEEFVEEGLTVLTKPTMLKELPLKIREALDS